MTTESTRAAELHKRALIVDGLVFSCDTDAVLRQGNVAAVNVTVSDFNADFEGACDDIAGWLARAADPAGPWHIVETVQDIHAARQANKIGLIMGWQNMRAIGDRLDRIRFFQRLGIRVMQLTYNERNFIGDGCLEPADAGLSLFGRRVITEMNRCGVAIDLSHVGHRSAMDAASLSERPVLLTHANAKAVSDMPRNKHDALIKAVAETGGLIGASVYGPMCWDGNPERRPTLEDFYRHLDHIVSLVGIEHVAFGTDFPAVTDLDTVGSIIQMTLDRYPTAITKYAAAFGNEVRTRYPVDCGSPAELGKITELLVTKGWKEADILAFLGGNYLRVLDAIWTV
ncbi:dipeptidase [Rhodoligotrophos defluvii]|uniref:dipeptidase n=1 Tax=Rhodoligotrophos defluvii TaxID=2561934 RepID=UPI0010C946C9|nr:membrane dipeptidase [Rhodoligotrophos defluvii]